MNPQIEQPPGLRLPQPSMSPVSSQSGVERLPSMPEQIEGGRETPQIAAAQPTPMLAQQSPVQQVVSTPISTQPQQVSVQASDDTSNASNLDEEWVTKAKRIVERTQADPYMQSAELGKFKADYLRSRHNKEVKVAEDSAK